MLTRHHIVARQNNGSDHVDNIVLLERKVHQRLHTFFGNALPHEQILMMTDIASTALQSQFRKDILQVIGDHSNQYYKGHTFKNGIWQ